MFQICPLFFSLLQPKISVKHSKNFSLPFKYLCCVTFLSWILSANFHCWTKTEAQSQKRREFIKSHFEFFNCRTFYFFSSFLFEARENHSHSAVRKGEKQTWAGWRWMHFLEASATDFDTVEVQKSLCQPTATLLLFFPRHFLPTRWHHVKWCNFAKQDFCIRIKLSELRAVSSITLEASWNAFFSMIRNVSEKPKTEIIAYASNCGKTKAHYVLQCGSRCCMKRIIHNELAVKEKRKYKPQTNLCKRSQFLEFLLRNFRRRV